MSRIKHPEEKKLLSLKHDRRSVFGENAKASRKTIPRLKQVSNQRARAVIAQVLGQQNGPSQNLDGDKVQGVVEVSVIESKRKGFKKKPDAPLGKVLLGKAIKKPLLKDKVAHLAPANIEGLRGEIRSKLRSS